MALSGDENAMFGLAGLVPPYSSLLFCFGFV